MCRILKIAGNSLLPEFQDGDFVITSKLSLLLKRPAAGDVVVFRMPEHGMLIKRVDHVLPGGDEVFVLGTDPLSTDSRLFGPVQVQLLEGRVINHIRRQKSHETD